MHFFKNSASEPRMVRMLRSLLFAIFVIVVILIISTLLVGISIENTKFPSLLGNQTEKIEYVKSHVDPDKFNFVVLGDVKDGTANFKSLLDLAELEKPSFIIILGDFANHLDKEEHKLFACDVSKYASKMPFFLVPGNHDIGLDSDFGIEDFHRIYGPSQFQFTIGPYLMVFLNDLPEYNQNGEYLNFLEKTLQENSGSAKKIFVFTHIPPSGISDSLKCSFALYSERFTDIVNKYNVDYVFSGHHHGYIKTVKNGTTYITSGGGGSKLDDGKGKFHHFVELDIKDGQVSENVVSVKHKHRGLELLKHNIAVHLWEPTRQNKLISTMGILYCFAAVFTVSILLKRRT